MNDWEARGRANRKYREKSYDRVEIMVRKGDRDRIRAAAEASGQSTAAYITRAVSDLMERDGLPGLAPLDKPFPGKASSGPAAGPGDGDEGDGTSTD